MPQFARALGPRADLLARAHAVLGLEVDEDVGSAEVAADRVLQLVGDRVGVLERGAGAELDVDVDVAAWARAAGAELVVAGHAAGAEALDRLADGGGLGPGGGLVDEHAPRAGDDPEAGVDDRDGDQQRDDRIDPRLAGDL